MDEQVLMGMRKESSSNTGSKIGSMTNFTTVFVMWSETVGTPRMRIPPDFLRIETALTAGGK
jgi:hypothetical protein